MATREAERTSELEALEERGPEIFGDGEPPGEDPGRPAVEFDAPAVRLAIVVGLATLAAAMMTGGVFQGVVVPRLSAAVAGLLGVAAAVYIRRLRNPAVMNIAIAVAVILIGILLCVPAGSLSDVINLGPFVREAVTSGDVQRPPVEFTLGWRAILGWLMGGLGMAAAWVAIEIRRPALGMLIPLPIVAAAAISVPDDAKVASGIVALVLFAAGLGVLSGIELGGDGEQRSLAFELRRAARALPLLAAITVGLVFLAQANVLFPRPRFDPTQSAQKPKAIPLSEVPDRVLFTVDSRVSGPWRMGSLDVYEENTWKLPPFAENRIREVPQTGIVDTELRAGVRATFETQGLTGAVLPGLPNLVGLVAEGPRLAYDSRTGVIRLSSGTIGAGLKYTVVAGRIPTVEELQKVRAEPPERIEGVPTERFLEIPDPPPAVRALIDRAPETSKWEEFDYLRNQLLDTVTASGAGAPREVSPERVEDMLRGSRQGTPFEIVAAQAMLARWVGIPARIGYGFDGGEAAEGGVLEVRPAHGATFVEVYFTGHKWLPIIGTPKKATTSFGNNPTQRRLDILPSDDVAVSLYVPFETSTREFLFRQIRRVVVVVLPILAALLLIYFGYPVLRKMVIRSRRRSWVHGQGPAERIALAYAEWRDLCTDYGYRYRSDTPLMFLDRVIPDDEHAELAWLVTRTMWGDLRNELSDADALAAEELARSLRRRLAQAHPWTLRTIAAFSRLSLRHPYAPQLDTMARRGHREEVKVA